MTGSGGTRLGPVLGLGCLACLLGFSVVAVEVRNLASRMLSLAARGVADDFEARYGIRPVLLESFVEQRRFRGTCYRAANWTCVGQTVGRGKCDRRHRARLPIKDIYLYPLQRSFRQALGVCS